MRLFRLMMTLIVATILFFVPFLILRTYIGPAWAFVIAAVLSGLAILIGLFKAFQLHEKKERKNFHFIEDRKFDCPNCGTEQEAAFMGDEIAMEYECPNCGHLIQPGEVSPKD